MIGQVFPKVGPKRAGVAPATLNEKFRLVRDHIFVGEEKNPKAGRHTLSSLKKAHPTLNPVKQNARNKIQEFDVRLISFSYPTPLLIFITAFQEEKDCLG